jgi:hypothetical protein
MTTKKPIPPHLRCEYDLPVVSAVQALAHGDATAEQQKTALTWIINQAAATYGQSYQETGDRDTAFAEGRRFVGLQLVKLTVLSTNALRKVQNPNA